jgi:hypothetical protein
MKKLSFLPAFLAIGLVLFTGCGKDDDNSEKLSPLKPEEHKAIIEEDGVKVIAELDGISNLNAIKVAQDFMDLMETSDNSSLAKQLSVSVANLETNPTASSASILKIASSTTLQAEFNSEAGVYEWNATAQDFVLVSNSSSDITYKFPSNGSSASITINNFVTAAPTKITVENYELLKSVTFSLKSGTTELLSLSFTGEYNAKDEPIKLVEELRFAEGYVIANTLINTGSTASIEQSFKNKTANIITYYYEVNGNLDYNNMTGEEAAPQELITSTKMSIALANIKVEGNLDVKGLLNDLTNNEIAFSESFAIKADADKMVASMNNYLKIKVKYNDTDEIISSGEFFTEKVDSYTYEVDMRMKFNDGTYVSDSYFEDGFSDFIIKSNQLITEMNSNYDMDFETIDQ